MNLLEALVALVILGLATVGYLDVFQTSTQSVGSAAAWSETVAVAESAMEEVLAGVQPEPRPNGYRSDVRVEPWQEGLSEVTVRVTSPSGMAFEIRRLVESSARLEPRVGLR